MAELREMSRTQLQARLAELRGQLEELEEEREFVLKQTGFHLPGHAVRKYEQDYARLKSEIVEIEKILAQSGDTQPA